MTSTPPSTAPSWRNHDVDWDSWPVQTYLQENYRQLHACDDAVLAHHSRFYRGLAPGRIDRSIELGAGPNLYPLMLAAAASRSIEAVDRSAANVAYVDDQIANGADASWQPFYDRCRALNPSLPATMAEALAVVEISQGDLAGISPGDYGLASMNFVAESISEDKDEVAELCRSFIESVRPGGHLVASFMENMARYGLGATSQWPGCPIDSDDVIEIFGPHVEHLRVSRIDADPDLPGYYGGYTGMIMLTASRRRSVRRRPASHAG